jgi:hypothetical protein
MLGIITKATDIAKMAMQAEEIISPLADYIAGVVEDKPPFLEKLPATLSARIELEKLKLRSEVAKAKAKESA